MVREGVAEVEREGLGRLSMRRVAERVDVSSAAPWHHFANRASFSAAIAASAFKKLQSHLERRISGKKSATENLSTAFQAYTRFAIENPGLYRAMFSYEVSEGLERLDMTNPKRDPHFEGLSIEKAFTFNIFVDLVREGQREGDLRDGDPSQLSRVVTSLAHGLSLEFIDEHIGHRISRRRQAADLFAQVLNGISKPYRSVSFSTVRESGIEMDMSYESTTTPAARVGMMWELAKNAWAFAGNADVESGLSRRTVRVQRRRR